MTTLDPGSRSKDPRKFSKYAKLLTYDGIVEFYKSQPQVNQGYLLFIPFFVIGLIVKGSMTYFDPFSWAGIVIGAIGLVPLLGIGGLAVWKFIKEMRDNYQH